MREIKNQRFKPGQAITIVENKGWVLVKGVPPKHSPKFGKIYHVRDYTDFYDGDWYIRLMEFESNRDFCESRFAPVVSDSILEKELEEVIKMEEQTTWL
jgi:hypothetical protein